jgi:hypothetical protein
MHHAAANAIVLAILAVPAFAIWRNDAVLQRRHQAAIRHRRYLVLSIFLLGLSLGVWLLTPSEVNDGWVNVREWEAQ